MLALHILRPTLDMGQEFSEWGLATSGLTADQILPVLDMST